MTGIKPVCVRCKIQIVYIQNALLKIDNICMPTKNFLCLMFYSIPQWNGKYLDDTWFLN